MMYKAVIRLEVEIPAHSLAKARSEAVLYLSVFDGIAGVESAEIEEVFLAEYEDGPPYDAATATGMYDHL